MAVRGSTIPCKRLHLLRRWRRETKRAHNVPGGKSSLHRWTGARSFRKGSPKPPGRRNSGKDSLLHGAKHLERLSKIRLHLCRPKGIYITWRIIKTIININLNGIALHKVYGWSVRLLIAAWTTLTQFCTFLEARNDPTSRKCTSDVQMSFFKHMNTSSEHEWRAQ